jgi:hypothetical protein
MVRQIKHCLLIAAFVLSLASGSLGQETTGNIEGHVSDASGARIPGATVQITSTSFDRTVTTDSDGFFRILQLPPGAYTIATSAPSFRLERREAVEVVLGNTTIVNVALQVGAVSEEVVITAAEVAPIDTTNSRIQTNITDREISLTPRGTNFSSVLQVAPAVRSEPLSGGFQIDGASGSENTFIIDGQEVTNFRTGTLNINNNIPFEFVQEVQVKSSGFEAEFGGATGGVINVVTKRGDNDFHGSIGTQFEPSRLSSRTRPIQSANEQTLTYFQFPRDSYTRFYPSAILSGPVIKERLWFFSSFAIQDVPTNRTFRYADGSAVTYNSRDRRDYGFIRLDSSVTDKLQLSGTYTYNPLKRNGILPTFNTIANAGTAANAVSPVAQGARGGRQPASNVSFSGVYTPTTNLVVSARGGRAYLNEKLDNYAVPTSLRILCRGTGNVNLPGVTPEGRCVSGFQNLTGNALETRDISIRQTFDADASYLFNLGGRHLLKGGYQLNRLSNDVLTGNVGRGTLVLNFGQTFDDAAGNPRGAGAGEFGYGFLQQFGETGRVSSKNEGFYIQDTWQPLNNLTLNLGIRSERETVPPFNTGPGLSFGLSDKIAPRLGFAYDIRGDGKFKIFASFGRFYDRFKYELPRGSFGGNIFTNDYFVITNPNYTAGNFQDAISRSFLQLNFRVPSNVRVDDPAFRETFGDLESTIDPDLKPVRQTEYTGGVEYGLGNDIVLGARYTHKQIDRTIEDVGVPDSLGNETYFIANPGEGITGRSLVTGVPATPKPQRDYDAVEFRLDKRFSQNYFINASYTYSRLFGNYGGLASADERAFAAIAGSDSPNVGVQGRTSPNVTRSFDLPFESFNTNGQPNNGRLATDRPHALKLFGGYTYNWFGKTANSTDFYASFIGTSGTPLTTNVDILDVIVVHTRRGDLGRTEKFTQTDFGFAHRYRFGSSERLSMVFEANVLNLFNEANEIDRLTLLSSAILGPSQLTGVAGASRTEGIRAIFNGGTTNRINALIGTAGVPRDARFNTPNAFQGPRQVRFGFRFQF